MVPREVHCENEDIDYYSPLADSSKKLNQTSPPALFGKTANAVVDVHRQGWPNLTDTAALSQQGITSVKALLFPNCTKLNWVQEFYHTAELQTINLSFIPKHSSSIHGYLG